MTGVEEEGNSNDCRSRWSPFSLLQGETVHLDVLPTSYSVKKVIDRNREN